MKIAFWDNCLCERGTTVSLFQYAYYNEKILGNTSIIMYNTTRIETDENVVINFQKHFQVIGVSSFDKVEPILEEINCDIFYITKAGEFEGQISHKKKTVVHCVFNCNEPHGQVYAAISNWIYGNNGRFPVVPYIAHLPEHDGSDMRNELGIPQDAIVFGRHGGMGQFDIVYAQEVVYQIAREKPNVYFVFLNTTVFCPTLPNIIHLEKIVDVYKKTQFINTCDAMLWARTGGETFGLAIAEFSLRNKPVIATAVGDLAHYYILKEKGIWYNNKDELYTIIKNFDKKQIEGKDWNAYREYSPENVMATFKKVFID